MNIGGESAKELYNIFSKSLPFLGIDKKGFFDRFGSGARLITENAGPLAAGFCIYEGSGIAMLCVRPECRGRGVGSRLLSRAEKAIAESGEKTAVLGLAPSGYVVQGVPYLEDKSAVSFFEKRGYCAEWTSVDMTMKIDAFECSLTPPPGVAFGYLREEERPSLMTAVEEVMPSWLPHFKRDREIYVARRALEGGVVGFELLSPDSARRPPCEGVDYENDGKEHRVGELGCVGVISRERSRGIGLAMVAEGTRELKRQGMDVCYIGFTHLEGWYSKLGYRAFARFWMSKKEL